MDRTTAISHGLFWAWVANDVEELITMQRDSRALAAASPSWLPVSDELRERGVSQAHIRTGISIMGGIMAAAALDGAASRGRSPFFQTVLLGFGLHGFGHLGQAAMARRWTSGSLTSPTVVIPYWLWASRELRRQDIDPRENVSWPMVASLPAFLGSVHALTWGLRRLSGVRRPLLDEV